MEEALDIERIVAQEHVREAIAAWTTPIDLQIDYIKTIFLASIERRHEDHDANSDAQQALNALIDQDKPDREPSNSSGDRVRGSKIKTSLKYQKEVLS